MQVPVVEVSGEELRYLSTQNISGVSSHNIPMAVEWSLCSRFNGLLPK